MSLVTKLRKLKRMPWGEIRHRLKEKQVHLRNRAYYMAGVQPKHSFSENSLSLLDYCKSLVPGVSAFCDANEASPVNEIVGKEAQLIRKTAESLMDGSVRLLGVDMRFISANWHEDPTSGHKFAEVFHGDVVTHQHGGNDIDVKFPWELSRHQYLVPLAQLWAIDKSHKAAEVVRVTILDWIKKNPVNTGVNWTSALEVAIRSISWIWCLGCTANWTGWSHESISAVRLSLAQHAAYLNSRLSVYSSPYNHLVGECAALYLLSHVLCECKSIQDWRANATQAMNACIGGQFYNDGFTREQTTSYHYFTLGFLCLAEAAARGRNDSQMQLSKWIAKAVSAGLPFQDAPGRWRRIGDCDSARSIPTAYREYWDMSGVATLAAALGDEALLPLEPDYSDTFWVLGAAGIEQVAAAPNENIVSLNLLNDSGYATMRSDDGDWLCLDGGPVADGIYHDATPSTAHGHLDALQVLATLDGEPLLVDSGVPYYFKESNWLEYYRGAAAHNTIAFEGVNLAEVCGTLMWNRVAYRSQIKLLAPAGDGWAASAMVEFCETSLVVTRYLMYQADCGFVVLDELPFELAKRATWHWHFAEGRVLQSCGASQYAVGHVGVHAISSVGVAQLSAVDADETSPRAYVAPRYGELVRHSSLISTWESSDSSSSKVHVLHAFLRPQNRVQVAGWGGLGKDLIAGPNDAWHTRLFHPQKPMNIDGNAAS